MELREYDELKKERGSCYMTLAVVERPEAESQKLDAKSPLCSIIAQWRYCESA